MKPNLVFIFADQMRGMDMGCAGNPDVKTPAMDRLASQGMRLTNTVATSPVCGPNRSILLTGLYATKTRVVANDLALSTEFPTLGNIAKANGYRTGYVGKWHLDGTPRTKFTPPGPRRFGFDYWAAYNCTHEYFYPKYYRDEPKVIEMEGYEPVVQTDLALAFLDQQSNQAPFCLALSWGPPHDPYTMVPDSYRELYDPTQLTLRPNAQPDAVNRLAPKMGCRKITACYYAAITALDDQLARIMTKLDERGLAENTIVIFTSDHGDMLWSHGWMKKQCPFEESINVPMIIRWPGQIKAGTVSDALLGTVDVLPTLLGLMKVKTDTHFDGRDISAQLLGGKGDDQAAALIANYSEMEEARAQGMCEWRGVRTLRHTYVEKTKGEPWLLFDNLNDPYQLKNLIGTDSALESKLRQKLQELLKASNDSSALPEKELMRQLGMEEEFERRNQDMKGFSGGFPHYTYNRDTGDWDKISQA